MVFIDELDAVGECLPASAPGWPSPAWLPLSSLRLFSGWVVRKAGWEIGAGWLIGKS